MPDIRPFAGIRYAHRPDLDLSNLIAPPYDVLDQAQKSALQGKHANNIVTIDLPFMPPKHVGPDASYAQANATMRAWLSAGILKQDRLAAFYPYQQTFEHHGKMFHRRGFITLVKLSPFGAGHVVPHELTHKGPIEDRLKLMEATGVQLSPIFGLFTDAGGEVTKALYRTLGRPESDATLDGIRHQMWSVTDSDIENEVIGKMGTKSVYIADGHHRYTTALAYQHAMEQRNGGPLPPSHPANWCMFVLVRMQDDGLMIAPTHRLIGGLSEFDIQKFATAISPAFTVEESLFTAAQLDGFAAALSVGPPHTFGLYDGKRKRAYQLTLKDPDILQKYVPDRSPAWRRLDVAILHRYLIDEVLKPLFAGGTEPTIGYTADAHRITPQVDGWQNQLALLLRSTPLPALEELGRDGETMPQKSTFFFPKLATGMIMNPLVPAQ